MLSLCGRASKVPLTRMAKLGRYGRALTVLLGADARVSFQVTDSSLLLLSGCGVDCSARETQGQTGRRRQKISRQANQFNAASFSRYYLQPSRPIHVLHFPCSNSSVLY